MQQRFTVHQLNGNAGKARSRADALTDAATEYFAYIALLTVGVVLAVMTMAFSANVAFSWLDKISQPGYFDSNSGDNRAAPTPSGNKVPAGSQTRGDQFAMLPAAMPPEIKVKVISSNF